MNNNKNGIGQPVPRKEDHRLLTGAGRYTVDVSAPGQAHAAIVRSPHAHARIVALDAARARAVPGVVDILLGGDIARDGIDDLPASALTPSGVDVALVNRDGSDMGHSPLRLLATDVARHVGEAVAMVIGETPAAALDGAEYLDVTYEPLDSVTATPDAVGAGAPAVWPHISGNAPVDADLGDAAEAEEAFARADHVVELTCWAQRVTGAMMEPRAALCDYDSGTGKFTIHCGGDNSVRLKRDLASVLGVEEDLVRVIAGDVGGNYGTRNWSYPEYALVAWASRRLQRPVGWVATRSEAFLSDYQGRDLHAETALALDKDGRFLALRSSLISNVGGHTIIYVPLNKSSELLTGVYDIPAAWVRARAALSNTQPTVPYRSAGRPEAMFILERLVDIAARRLGIDRVELRRRNIIAEDATPYDTALGLTYDSGHFERAMDRALALGDWDGFPARRDEARTRNRLRGIGLANYIEITGGYPVERSEITVRPEGRVEVVIGTTSSGQGHETSFAQCIAEWLGVNFDAVQMIAGDTDIVKEGGGSHSARSMRMAGIVMGTASDRVIERGREIAGRMLEAAPADISFAGGRFIIAGTDRSVGIFEISAFAEVNSGELLSGECQEVIQIPGYPYGAQVCEVEIEPETGTVEIVHHAAVDDVGRAINPLILHGQTHGGAVQGAGQALMEHIRHDPVSGQLLTGSLLDYAMPRADDFPFFDVEIKELPSPTNPLGVRGGGEGGATPALAVVINAIVDALAEFGVEHIEMPATPERIWRAIGGK
ncbi:MAG: xanthine dehydrogenase family protein molybdopterin-binding subunit [Pseudomonadota bacterium]|nr:xanthine dehydrogenase family protein molybdopterin-binding subunit [Pseudomonadota bacterium]